MNKLFFFVIATVFCASCAEKTEPGRFTVQGELKNAGDQKIYLEQLFFSPKDPEVLDTGEIKNGKFSVSAIGNEQGLYRLRLEKQEAGYIFINDSAIIKFRADINDQSLRGPDFRTPANISFKKFLTGVDSRQTALNRIAAEADSLKNINSSDSLIAAKILQLNTEGADFKKFIVKSIDTISDPVVTMFALGYTRGIDPAELKTIVPGLGKKFPDHRGIEGIIGQYNEMMAKKNEVSKPVPGGNVAIGSMAPEISMKDTAGKIFLLSALKGKYVLVDFWASWCAPCRGENPNVVANYRRFKNKNFTILGVSLDEDRAAWIKAIKKDSLDWKQVSDLKGWGSAAASAYGFNGIPYNVLLDPQGKIIATELREEELGKQLGTVLK